MGIRMHIALITFCAHCAWQPAPSGCGAAPPSYVIASVNWSGDIPYDINDAALVAGDGGLHVGIWELVDGTWESVCCPDEFHVISAAHAVNEFGEATGWYLNTFAGAFVPLWHPGETSPLLISYGQGEDINSHAQIVGLTSDGGPRPTLFEDGEQILLSEEVGAAYGINDNGHIVGILWNPATRRAEPVLWEGAPEGEVTTTFLASFGGDGVAEDISEDGWIVGKYSFESEQPGHAFLWHDEELIDLGTFGGSTSWARAINDHHQIVGTARNRDQENRAFLWQDGTMYDLNDLVVDGPPLTLFDARGVNNRGHIVGRAETSEGDNTGFILVPVLQGDLTTDGFVDANDLGVLLGAWSLPPGSPGCKGAMPCSADLNADGFVNAADLAILLGTWTG